MFRLVFWLTCLLVIASVGPSQAAPQNSPGTIYIDGVPCNLPCQSYMAWSRQVLSQHTTPAASRAARPARIAHLPAKARQQHVARLPVPRPSVVVSAGAAGGAPAHTEAAPAIAGQQSSREAATVPPIDTPLTPAAPAPAAQEANTNSVPPNAAESDSANTATAALQPRDSSGEMVAILLVRPDINSASDLANKIVAVDEAPAEYSVTEVRNAMVAAGATEVQLVENKTAALVRIMDGEVQAAIVSVLPAKAADVWNGGLSGFKVLRVKLPAHSETPKRG